MTSSQDGFALRGSSVVTRAGVVEADVAVSGGAIAGVGHLEQPCGLELDACRLLVAPGFIDLQVNGAHGVDLTTEPQRLWEVGAALAGYGTTGFLPTIVTAPADVPRRAIEALAAGPPEGWIGTNPLGLHLEGPMLSAARKGAHVARHLREPSRAIVEGWSREAGVAIVTLAPELPGALDVVRELVSRGVVVAVGHTDASADVVLAAVDAGATYITHLFNAMAPFGHRAPGPPGVALADDRLVVGLIADGLHVDPLAVTVAWRALGPDRLDLVTDAVAALGRADGPAWLGEVPVQVGPDGIRTADGTLAGSKLSIDQAVRNLVSFTGCRVHEAVATVTSTPARLLGLPAKGMVAVGADADLTILTPELDVAATIVAGRVIHTDDRRAAWRS